MTSSFNPDFAIAADPPYIAQNACTFWLVTPTGTLSTVSERGSGISGNATLNWGDYQLGLSDCEVVGNPQNLPIFHKDSTPAH